ncbi:MAG: carboxypeptidase-like regulatory domain-containing protein [Elusimicrobiota bacterium]|jgi:hypothetical protein
MECPGCHEAISGKLETCPHCFYDLRAHRGAGAKKAGLPGYEDLDGPDPEIVPVPDAHVDNVHYKPKASPFRYVLLALVFVLGVALFYLGKDFMRERRAAEEMTAAIANKPAQALPPAATAAATVPAAGTDAPAAAEEPVETPAPEAPAPAAPAPVEAEFWRFEGRVYDILSLKPVAGANLTFLADDGGQGGAVSGSDGRFRVKLPSSSGGYRVIVDQSDYDGDHFDDPSANYRSMTLAARAVLRNSVPKHRPWKGGAGTVRRDIALFPLSPDSQE